MKEQNSILDKGISLWWDSLSEDEKQRKLLRNGFESILVTGEWKVKCYHAEHPTKEALESHTEDVNKEGGESMSKEDWIKGFKNLNADFVKMAILANDLKKDNLKLLSDVKVLREALEGLYNSIDDKLLQYRFGEEIGIAKSALEQTKQ